MFLQKTAPILIAALIILSALLSYKFITKSNEVKVKDNQLIEVLSANPNLEKLIRENDKVKAFILSYKGDSIFVDTVQVIKYDTLIEYQYEYVNRYYPQKIYDTVYQDTFFTYVEVPVEAAQPYFEGTTEEYMSLRDSLMLLSSDLVLYKEAVDSLMYLTHVQQDTIRGLKKTLNYTLDQLQDMQSIRDSLERSFLAKEGEWQKKYKQSRNPIGLGIAVGPTAGINIDGTYKVGAGITMGLVIKNNRRK